MTKTTTLQVSGMTCNHCEARVEKALDDLNGVGSADVDRATGRVEVSYEEDRVNDVHIREAIGKAGYSVQS